MPGVQPWAPEPPPAWGQRLPERRFQPPTSENCSSPWLQAAQPGCRFSCRVSSKVLIADSNGEASGLLASWLTAAGHVCTTTVTGDALSDARRLIPDVAII